MIPSDMNGLADPYVKGQLGPYRFRTKIQKKTLAPKWLEEFRIPICSWEAPNVLGFEVRDKDHIFDDMMGDCSINISDLRGGRRHEKWLTLHNIKKGRLHLAITVLEGNHEKEKGQPNENERLSRTADTSSPGSDSVAQKYSGDASFEENLKVADEFEPINIEGQEKTGIWVHHPGSEVCQTWEPRKGRARRPEIQLCTEDVDSANNIRSKSSVSLPSETSSSGGGVDGSKVRKHGVFKRGLHKIGSIFNRSSKNHTARHRREKIIPRHNMRAVGDRGISVNLIVEGSCRKGAVEVLSESIVTHSSRKYKTILSRNMDGLQQENISDLAVMECSEKHDSFNGVSGENILLSSRKEPINSTLVSFRDQDSGSNPCLIGEDTEPNHGKANV